MKKLQYLGIVAILAMASTSCIAPQQASASTSGQSTSTGIGQNVGQLGDILGNIISSVTGSLTTTQANLIGTWSYYEPCVQFESENLLKKAGGAAAATKMEDKLNPIYQMVGITPGKLTFTFTNDGKVSYTIGSRTMSGTYVFDSKAKTVTIKTANGMSITSYVTISGRNMSLCFDSSKVLSLFSAAGSLSSLSATLGSLGTLAQTYSGMKTGFKFKK